MRCDATRGRWVNARKLTVTDRAVNDPADGYEWDEAYLVRSPDLRSTAKRGSRPPLRVALGVPARRVRGSNLKDSKEGGAEVSCTGYSQWENS